MKRSMHSLLISGYTLLFFLSWLATAGAQEQSSTREAWLKSVDRLVSPVLSNLAAGKLKEVMPVVLSGKCDDPVERKKVAYLEAFARTLCGVSPWLNLEGGTPREIALRNQYREWALMAIANAVKPEARDYMLWSGKQPLVDASFFALALVRCPWLWEHLDKEVRANVITALEASRSTSPYYSNWLLFPGMIEAFFCKYDLPYDAMRIDYGVRQFEDSWYVGDGMFSDGKQFAMDYYNSFVIQPYLANILYALDDKDSSFNWFLPELEKINARYAKILERLISEDGSFPALGRSIVYRGAAFHHLSDMALRHKLPEGLQPAQVRCALTAVIKKTMDAPGTFTKEGWLTIGLSGDQPGLAESYITTGSLYLCTTIFLPLGLPPDDPFWTSPDLPWTAKKVWNGVNMPADHSISD
jgi:hypothetical protein